MCVCLCVCAVVCPYFATFCYNSGIRSSTWTTTTSTGAGWAHNTAPLSFLYAARPFTSCRHTRAHKYPRAYSDISSVGGRTECGARTAIVYAQLRTTEHSCVRTQSSSHMSSPAPREAARELRRRRMVAPTALSRRESRPYGGVARLTFGAVDRSGSRMRSGPRRRLYRLVPASLAPASRILRTGTSPPCHCCPRSPLSPCVCHLPPLELAERPIRIRITTWRLRL